MNGLSIIIVNYWSVEMILQCVTSFINHKFDFALEVIVSDNGSLPSDKNRLEQTRPKIKWLSNGSNLGFGRANNKAFKEAKYDVILMLNPDTIISPNTINNIYNKFLMDKDNPGIVGVQTIDSKGNELKSYFQEYASYRQILRQNILIDKLNLLSAPTESVKAVHGACMIVSRSTLCRVGVFDEDFFLYFEEIELCHRALINNVPIKFYSDIKVLHIGEATQSNKLKTNIQRNISNCLLFLKLRGRFGVLMFIGLNLFNISTNFLMLPFMDSAYKKNYCNYCKAFLMPMKYYINIFFKTYSKPLKY